MAKLTDYVGLGSLNQLRDEFSELSGTNLWITDPYGTVVCGPDDLSGGMAGVGLRAAVLAGGDLLGYVVSEPTNGDEHQAERNERFRRLLADVLARLCERGSELRSRVDALMTLFRLTAEFAEQRELHTLLNFVARTVVDSLDAKACAIRLLSDDRSELLIQAVVGLSPEYLNKGRILLADSQIDRAVLSGGEPMVIPDMRTDSRVLYPTEAQREGIVSGLCAPLIYKGRPEGVIRVYTAEPHEFDWFETSLLQAIATEAAAAIVHSRLDEEAVHSANMKRQLRLAAEVQRRMIPTEPPHIPGFDIGTVYVSCFELGGDFFDFVNLPPDNLGVAVCDVAGKGVRASLLMSSTRAWLRAHAEYIYDMSEVLQRVNTDLCADTLISDFATLFYGVLNVKDRRFTYANAGHVPPIMVRSGWPRMLNVGGPVLGIDTDLHWDHEVIDLRSGDVLLLFTDGLTEAMNFRDEPFGRRRTEEAAIAAIEKGRSAAGIVKDVLWEMRRFAGLQTRLDDVTIVAIKVV